MNTKLMQKTILFAAAAVALSVTSCSTVGQNLQNNVIEAAGTAAVDTATQNNPLAGEAIRNTTGFGTSPEEKAKAGILSGLGL